MTVPTDVEFVDQVTTISEAWLDGVNDWVYGSYGVLGAVYTASAFRTALGAEATRTALTNYDVAEVSVASATTTDIGAAASSNVLITGTTTITGFGTVASGTTRKCRFDGALTLTHNGTSLILPYGVNITTAAGDSFEAESLGSGNWKVLWYQRANSAVTTSGLTQSTSRVLGRTTAATGAIEELTLTQVLDLVGSAAQGDILYRDAASWARLGAGTSGQFLKTQGAGANPAWASASGIVLGTPVASTSGTAIDFTSIPAGTKRITVSFNGVSTNGSSNLMAQIGDSGGIETTSYTSSVSGGGTGVSTTTFTTGFGICAANAAANLAFGIAVFVLVDSSTNTWSYFTGVHNGNFASGGGIKALSAELDRIRITTVNGTDTFDAGSINISYE